MFRGSRPFPQLHSPLVRPPRPDPMFSVAANEFDSISKEEAIGGGHCRANFSDSEQFHTFGLRNTFCVKFNKFCVIVVAAACCVKFRTLATPRRVVHSSERRSQCAWSDAAANGGGGEW